MPQEFLEVTATFRIPLTEVEWRFTGSGGPGGQHANTANTRVELTWDVASSAAPTTQQRALLLDRLGPSVRVVASDERSQGRNRDLALDRLRQRLVAALHVDPPRRATRPTRGSQERRLEAKRAQGERKRQRRPEPE